MNYFMEANKNFLGKVYSDFNFEIDKLPCLRKDISIIFNVINEGHEFNLIYDEKVDKFVQFINSNEVNLGLDYIGPSKYNLSQEGVSADIILLMEIQSRFIGGHIFFPTKAYLVKGKNKDRWKSLNQIRSFRFRERLDYFLLELKAWFKGENRVFQSKPVFEGNRVWLSQFKDDKGIISFNKYIDYFKLNDFVTDDYEVYDLSSYGKSSNSFLRILYEQPNSIDDLTKNYVSYSIGCVHAIEKRTERILSAYNSVVDKK